jgi:flagellar hook-basal body complex protein FliE
MFYKINDVTGHIVDVAKTDPKHLSGHLQGVKKEEPNPEKDFGALFTQALSNVNDQVQTSQAMNEAMITDPDSVNVHDVMIAGAEANLGLGIAKAVIDRALRAYQTLTQMR